MKKFITFIIISVNFLLFVNISKLYSGVENSNDHSRWDLCMIKEAHIWKYLLVDYMYADYKFYWPERKETLQKVIDDFPDSRWADDAALLLAGGQASIEGDLDGAIRSLRKIIEVYPLESTIIAGWDSERGCLINEAWLMWVPSLAFLNLDRSIRASYIFDQDGEIDILEREALTYFTHIEKYPAYTKDVAKFVIASILKGKEDFEGAISELESLIADFTDLPKLYAADREIASNPEGYLINCEPPFDTTPILRVQYEAYLSLLSLYRMQGNKDKTVEVGLKLVSTCTPDGWYWNINRYVGNLCLENSQYNLASEQYNLALQGIRSLVSYQALRHEDLNKKGFLSKPNDFFSWEENALRSYKAIIVKLEEFLENVDFYH